MLRQTQNIRLSQKIVPQVLLKQTLLSIPLFALEQVIKNEIDSNPLLEESNNQSEESDNLLELDNKLIETNKLQEKNKNEILSEKLSKEEYNSPVNYSSHDGIFNDYVNQSRQIVSMYDNLNLQLHLEGLTNKQIFIGEYIIGNLNDDGYLLYPITEIIRELDENKINTEFENDFFTENEVLTVLKIIQKFDPVGIASRDLKECLLNQVDEAKTDDRIKDLGRQILTNYFEEFRLKNYEKISNNLNITLPETKEIFNFLHSLNPKPGYTEENLKNNYIIPDIFVTKKEGRYLIFLNEKDIPALKINKKYLRLLKESKDENSKEFSEKYIERAKSFLDAINSRQHTIYRVMEAILENQKKFFENNGVGLKPLYEKDIAAKLEMDTSTISRAVKGKYVQTDFGIYELRDFFSNAVLNSVGNEFSSKELKNILKSIIENEDKTKPLNDEELMNELKRKGFNIARRTVVKYREAMGIPNARLRRKI